MPNPFFGQIASGIDSTPTVSRAQLLRPYPQFDTINAVNQTWATSNYHALEVKVEKRYSHGLNDGRIVHALEADGLRHRRVCRENAGRRCRFRTGKICEPTARFPRLDQPNRFILNTVYELPGKYAARRRGQGAGVVGS